MRANENCSSIVTYYYATAIIVLYILYGINNGNSYLPIQFIKIYIQVIIKQNMHLIKHIVIMKNMLQIDRCNHVWTDGKISILLSQTNQ